MEHIRIAAFADEAGRPLEKQISALKRNGISLLEIRFVGQKNISEITPDEAREIRRRLADDGIAVWSIGSPTGKISVNDPFPPHLDAFKRQLELAEILGATRYRLFSFYDAGDDLAAVTERLGQVLDAAEGSGVVLCHENEKKIYGDTAERCAEILRQVPGLRTVFDPANFVQCRQPTLAAWEMLEPWVDYLHVKDCDGTGRVVLPGDGEGNLRELLRRYAARGGGIVTLEPHLTKFIGLETLERGETTRTAYSFPDGDAAFDAAAAALRRMVEEPGAAS